MFIDVSGFTGRDRAVARQKRPSGRPVRRLDAGESRHPRSCDVDSVAKWLPRGWRFFRNTERFPGTRNASGTFPGCPAPLPECVL